jgi:CubicO group peptidase (beta-lactamase class C family)
MAKSFTQALIGVAVLDGRVDIDLPLKSIAHPDPKLNLRSLMTLTDGLQWDEGSYSPVDSDATKMIYGPGRLNGAAYLAARPQAHPPGTHWNYSTGAFQLAAAELQLHLFPQAVTAQARRGAMAAWMRQRLFAPLGMTTALAEFDASGGLYGGSLIYACARDYARFGELYRLDGVCNGRRILPEGWVKFAHTPTVEPTYGAGFWLEAKAGSRPSSLMGGAGPLDAYSAQGHAGQLVVIVPSKSAVVVRLGLMNDDDAAWKRLGQWIAPVVDALPDTKAA